MVRRFGLINSLIIGMFLLGWGLVSGRAATDTEPKAIGLKAANFTLQDQFEKAWKWADHWRGKPTVLVMSDWKGSSYIDAWTAPLAAKYKGRVAFVAMADLSLTQEAPSFMQGTIQNTIRGRFADAYTLPILMDWKGTVVQYYRIRSGLPNVLFIDANGIVQLHTWGKGSEQHLASFTEAMERHLQ